MPPKKQLPLPIDRPLSRAYLRQFSGWSTEYPPGLSDPTSLRRMENVWVGRDGGVRTRPGLRYLTYSQVPTDEDPGLGIENRIVGTHETFFLNDGSQAYLFAVSENDGTVGFRVLSRNSATSVVMTLAEAGFTVPQTEAVLNFSADTTYVKYLQIDNKVFALSNAGESMRFFDVGTAKTARKLNSIERPAWDVEDKLTVLHPEAGWIDDGLPSSTRFNLIYNPSFEATANNWLADNTKTKISRSTTLARSGVASLRVESKPTAVNLMTSPLADVASDGYPGWISGGGAPVLSVVGNYLHVAGAAGSNPRNINVQSPIFDLLDIEPLDRYQVGFDLGSIGSSTTLQVVFRWLSSSGSQIGSDDVVSVSGGGSWKTSDSVEAPANAVKLRVLLRATIAKTGASSFEFRHVTVSKTTLAQGAYFDGDSGANYFWTGTAGASASVYHPPVDVVVKARNGGISATEDYVYSQYVRAGTTARSVALGLRWLGSGDVVLSTSYDAGSNDASGSWTRFDHTQAAPADAIILEPVVKILAVPRGEYHYLDDGLLELGTVAGTYFDGDTADTGTEINSWVGVILGGPAPQDGRSRQIVYSSSSALPTAETPTADTLISSDPEANDYNFGFFYVFSNEIGDSAPSQVTVVKAQRAWSAWRWETPNASGEPSGTATADPRLCADQLVAIMPEDVFDEGMARGAVSWSLYMVTWSDQATVPSAAVRVGTQILEASSDYLQQGRIRMTPQQVGAAELTLTLPNMNTLVNYSDPSRGGQGLVASDRMVMVLDPTRAAQIKWSSNQLGSYTDFTANKGGGYKTLVSGNLYVPACVKLWQNPQSVDTLTILCLGTDGRSTSYYMAPAQITSQSEAVTVMGFEETTATPGTTSPYGCEVFNNALYHPLDDQLMKSTANNYNINHKSMTDQIRRQWSKLVNKQRIVSSQHDSRLYYIVHNPEGEALEPGCRGNELWVFDAQAKEGTWSRWLIQASSLRTIERDGRIYMAVSRPDGLFYLDPDYAVDDVVEADLTVSTRTIRWYLETNTQGANRAHDAWAWLYQVNVTLGNFVGTMSYGIRSQDRHGKLIDISKQITPPDTAGQLLPFDVNDKLKIGRDVMEWYFYASSVDDADGNPLPSAGQLNLVQYRYTPVSVNVGYDEGSVETFEYGRSLNPSAEQTTLAGVPLPMADTRRP